MKEAHKRALAYWYEPLPESEMTQEQLDAVAAERAANGDADGAAEAVGEEEGEEDEML